MKRVVLIVILLITFRALSYSECWDSKELGNLRLDELENTVTLSFKDAVDCIPVPGADVWFMDQNKRKFYLKTDSAGYAKFPLELIEHIEDGYIFCMVKKEGYITLKMKIPVLTGAIWQQRFLMSKEIPLDNVRFVLQWGESPADLDLHLKKKKDFHISYRNMQSIPNLAKLDRDDVNGYGPETITLDRIESGAEYKLYVHNYSNEAPFPGKNKANEVKVFVYSNNKLDKCVTLPSSSKRIVNVLSIRNKKITYSE